MAPFGLSRTWARRSAQRCIQAVALVSALRFGLAALAWTDAAIAFAWSRYPSGYSPQRAQIRRRAAKSFDGEEFEKAREKIRRIQLGLDANAPLPPDKPETGGIELADADDPDLVPKEVEVNVTGDANTTDATGQNDKDKVVEDPFAVKADDVEELKPDPAPGKDNKNVIEGLADDFTLITWPATGDVLATFGIVILLVSLYTAFVAVVDFSAQKVLGEVFSEFYQAARPEAPSM